MREIIKTAFALGLPNLWRIFKYRLSVRLDLNPVKRLCAAIPSGNFFRMPENICHTDLPTNTQWNNNYHCYFGWYVAKKSSYPDWHSNPFNNKSISDPYKPWWKLPDFDPDFGDIKTIWETSRFDWVVAFSQKACQRDESGFVKLNSWLQHWIQNNPPYRGANWKCGQEASIRVMNLAISAIILDQVTISEPALIALIYAHLKRIAPTIDYAIAQDNNHGTSEAAALFIGGSWLALQLQPNYQKEGKAWQNKGLRWLENRAERLIEKDGSFSQYSVNYHRVMLDTFSMAEIWRTRLNLPKFSNKLYSRLSKAADWLYQLTQPETGDAPNLGANDGARLLPLTDTDYRDFRPSVQLAMILFNRCSAYKGTGSWNLPLQWLNLTIPSQVAQPLCSLQFDNGGYSILRRGGAFVMLNYPRFRFRPSQADALHIDFWLNGHNLFRDAGTFSYSGRDEDIHYFGGTESHNTVQFDGRDQMPRLSRFLLGDWLKSEMVIPVTVEMDCVKAGAGYTDRKGARHHRIVTLLDKILKVEDCISGFRDKAVLRWRLEPGIWSLKGNVLDNGVDTLTVYADIPIDRIELVHGWESRYYLQKSIVPVLELEVSKPGHLFTEYSFTV